MTDRTKTNKARKADTCVPGSRIGESCPENNLVIWWPHQAQPHPYQYRQTLSDGKLGYRHHQWTSKHL